MATSATQSVAFVDDDANLRLAFANLLRAAGLAVETFASAEDFLRLARRESICSLVLDLDLPGMSGPQLLWRLRAGGWSIPIACVTGRTEAGDTIELLEAGAQTMLPKPFDAEELLRWLQCAERIRWNAAGTLGRLLCAGNSRPPTSESRWVALVRSVAAGDVLALHALFQRIHRVVFTLIRRITHDEQTAEQMTLEVFHDVWRRASTYDAADGSVVGWIMNQARSRAVSSGAASVESCASWPTDVLHPSSSLWERVAGRVAEKARQQRVLPATREPPEPEWEEVAPGIAARMLAADFDTERASMLVRLAPGVAYPPHRHAGVEELHLLHGELWIENRKLHPGDYSRAEPGTDDNRVWSEIGCTCLLMTSLRDVLR